MSRHIREKCCLNKLLGQVGDSKAGVKENIKKSKSFFMDEDKLLPKKAYSRYSCSQHFRQTRKFIFLAMSVQVEAVKVA